MPTRTTKYDRYRAWILAEMLKQPKELKVELLQYYAYRIQAFDLSDAAVAFLSHSDAEYTEQIRAQEREKHNFRSKLYYAKHASEIAEKQRVRYHLRKESEEALVPKVDSGDEIDVLLSEDATPEAIDRAVRLEWKKAQQERKREYQRVYGASEKGRETRKAARGRYMKTPEGREQAKKVQATYRKTAKGKEANRRSQERFRRKKALQQAEEALARKQLFARK